MKIKFKMKPPKYLTSKHWLGPDGKYLAYKIIRSNKDTVTVSYNFGTQETDYPMSLILKGPLDIVEMGLEQIKYMY